MLNLTNFIQKFEKKFPKTLAESWDNVGLIIGRKNINLKKILVCLDITENVVDKAVLENVDLIIAHHPLIFSGQKTILEDNFLGRKILKLIGNNISVYGAHTNVDSADGGLNDYVLEKMAFNGKKLDFELKPLRYFELDEYIDIEDIIYRIKENLKIDNVRLARSYRKNKIKKIAITTGAGDSFIPEVISNEVDLFITGDLKHHISLDSIESGIHLLDIDHYGSEKLVSDLFEKVIKEIDPNIEVINFNDKEIFEYF